MNKRVITTSLALVLAMTVVLAVGKTDSAVELELAQHSETIKARPHIELDAAGVDILSEELSTPVQQANMLIIPPEVNESELILEQAPAPDGSKLLAPASSLHASLARMQQALDRLEQIAASTERAVDALDRKLVVR